MRTSAPKQSQYAAIGDRIKQLRERAGMSQEELSKKIGRHSASAIYYIEQGDRRIKVLDLIVIAKALGVSMDMLLLGEGRNIEWNYPVGHLPQKMSKPVWNEVISVFAL